MKRAMRIGILGGTFNPIHYGHLRMASEARFLLRLDRVIFVPSARPPHKEEKKMPAPDDRYEITKLAARKNRYFIVLDIELKRKGKSYTVDTLRQLRQIYPQARFYFIIGSDNLSEIPTWRNYRTVLKMCEFVVIIRPGCPVRSLCKKGPDFWIGSPPIFMEVPGLDISSTDIRERIRSGKTIKYLVPEKVEGYIKEKGLYGGK